MANQFTSGGGSKGPKKEHDQATKDKIRAELLAQRMYKFAKAKGKSAEKYRMDSAQVAAAKVLIDKGKPSLQAVEQVEVNQWDKMSEEEIGAMVHALISSHPGLIQKLGIGLRSVEAPQQTGIDGTSKTQEAAK